MSIRVVHSDNLPFIKTLHDESIDLIYIDPPFNTGRLQERKTLKTVRDADGDRTGFGGNRYKTTIVGQTAFVDTFAEYLDFLQPRLKECLRLLKPTGSLFVHLDPHEVHYVKVVLDTLFGRKSFINEIIWSYDYGGRSKSRWSAKHDNILWYAKDPKSYTYNYDAIDRIPYLAPGLVGPVKAALGKTPTDVWWHTIVPPGGKEKTGYATQKPLGIIRRIINVHTNPNDIVLDFFAGSGTLGHAAREAGRNSILVDENDQAIEVMKKRFEYFDDATFE
jgi:site-specific DNA-methyltransferase (adenine-specific)